MYNVDKITACLTGLVGFRQTIDSNEATLDADLLESRSGLVVQNVHPIITQANIEAAMPLESDITFAAYDNTKTYQPGAIIKEDGKLYLYIGAAGVNHAPADNNYWQQTNYTSVFLREHMQAAIIQVVATATLRKKVLQQVKALLENRTLFEGPANYANRETNYGRFVGYQIVFKNEKSLAAIINRIGTQFIYDGAQFTLNVYVFHTSNQEPITTIPVSISASTRNQWMVPADLTIGFDGDTVDPGGAWFIGYYEEDLPGNAVNKTGYNFLNGPCATCDGNTTNFLYWQQWFRYITVMPFSIEGSKYGTKGFLWDWQQNTYYQSDKTFGLNLQITIKCDLTAFICMQQDLFKNAIQLQFAVDFLKLIGYNANARINRVQENLSQKALFALDNRENKSSGLVADLDAEIDSINFDMGALNSVCLPCTQKAGVNYKAI